MSWSSICKVVGKIWRSRFSQRAKDIGKEIVKENLDMIVDKTSDAAQEVYTYVGDLVNNDDVSELTKVDVTEAIPRLPPLSDEVTMVVSPDDGRTGTTVLLIVGIVIGGALVGIILYRRYKSSN